MSTSNINNFQISFPGQSSCIPRFGHLYAPLNTLAQVTAAGYLDLYVKTQSLAVLPSDLIAVVASDGSQFYKPVFTPGTNSITLTALP